MHPASRSEAGPALRAPAEARVRARQRAGAGADGGAGRRRVRVYARAFGRPARRRAGLEKRRRALLQTEYVDYVDEDDEDDIAPTGSPVDDLAPAPAPA